MIFCILFQGMHHFYMQFLLIIHWFPVGHDLGLSLREICAGNRSDEKQVNLYFSLDAILLVLFIYLFSFGL